MISAMVESQEELERKHIGNIAQTYQREVYSPMRTDFYEMNMADAFNGLGQMKDRASFYFHWRKPAFSKDGEGYTTSVGLEAAADFFKNYIFTKSDEKFLRSIKGSDGKPALQKDTVDKLIGHKLDVNVYAMHEGTPVCGAYPDLRVDGPLDQCLVAETLLMTLNNQASNVATRGSRLMEASGGRPVANMSLRRAGTIGFEIPRAAAIGGIKGLADVGAAKELGLGDELMGTMAHLWIQKHVRDGISNKQAEFEAFCHWLKKKPGAAVLLADTFDIEQGVENAIKAAKTTGVALSGIRIDTGNERELLNWAYHIDKRLEEEAKAERDANVPPEKRLFQKTGIYLTNDLDEYKIDWMRRTSIQETGKWSERLRFGVGTALGNPGPLGGVYKLSSYEAPFFEAPLIKVEHETSLSNAGVATQMVEGFDSQGDKDGRNPVITVVRTMKVAGVDKSNPARPRPGSKSSLPGVELDAARLRDKNGDILGDVIVDTAFWDKSLSTEENLRKTGFFVKMSGDREQTQLPEFASAELLLQQVFKSGKYNYKWPHNQAHAKRAYEDGPVITNIPAIREYGIKERRHLPEAVRRIEKAERLPIFLDPRIEKEQMKIIEKISELPVEIKTAFVDVDIDRQKGFSMAALSNAEGGSLYVPHAEDVAGKAGEMMAGNTNSTIVLSQDFHPEGHISFMTNHPGVMKHRESKVENPADAHNPLKLQFTEMVLDEEGQIIGVKEGQGADAKIRKIDLISAKTGQSIEQGFTPDATDRGRIARVLEEAERLSFDETKKINPGIHTQMLWTPHCIQNTQSAEFVDELKLPNPLKDKLANDKKSSTITYVDETTNNQYFVVRKGMNSELDSYGIGLENDKFTQTAFPFVMRKVVMDLQKKGFKKATFNIKGLATNFCVEHSHNNLRAFLDSEFAKASGIDFEVNFLGDQSAAIPIPGGVNDAYSERGSPERMAAYAKANPTKITNSDDVMREKKRHAIPGPEISGDIQISGGQSQVVAR